MLIEGLSHRLAHDMRAVIIGTSCAFMFFSLLVYANASSISIELKDAANQCVLSDGSIVLVSCDGAHS